jgi:protoporphyrinogen oxidase
MSDGNDELMQVPEDSATQKADSLVDTSFTVLDIEYADTSDGRTHVQKMLVRHADQTLGLYWTPSSWTRRQLEDWFRRRPGKELFATLAREPLSGGGFKWMLVQRKATLDFAQMPRPESGNTDQIPFGAEV